MPRRAYRQQPTDTAAGHTLAHQIADPDERPRMIDGLQIAGYPDQFARHRREMRERIARERNKAMPDRSRTREDA